MCDVLPNHREYVHLFTLECTCDRVKQYLPTTLSILLYKQYQNKEAGV